MIQEEYVTFETAKLLKEAGFPQDGLYACHTQSYNDGILKTMYLKPTQAQAMRWLREEKNISVEPHVTLDAQWLNEVWEFDKIETISPATSLSFPNYEASAEAGIQAACKYLIEKTNQNQPRK